MHTVPGLPGQRWHQQWNLPWAQFTGRQHGTHPVPAGSPNLPHRPQIHDRRSSVAEGDPLCLVLTPPHGPAKYMLSLDAFKQRLQEVMTFQSMKTRQRRGCTSPAHSPDHILLRSHAEALSVALSDSYLDPVFPAEPRGVRLTQGLSLPGANSLPPAPRRREKKFRGGKGSAMCLPSVSRSDHRGFDDEPAEFPKQA